MIFTQEDKLDLYDETMERAKMQIPLYCKEWTNFHPSDPGITILENLFAFQLNQQRQISSVSPEVQEKLLNMMNLDAVTTSAPGSYCRHMMPTNHF